MLTAERLRELLSYDPDTGEFRWLDRGRSAFTCDRLYRSWKTRCLGRVAGKVDTHGHRQIRVQGVAYAAHRLAWLYIHGCWPIGQIDHINGDPADNRVANLRDVTALENGRNVGVKSCNRSGVVGVHKWNSSFRARIRANGREKHIGMFPTLEEAAAARRAAEAELGYHPNHGQRPARTRRKRGNIDAAPKADFAKPQASFGEAAHG